MSVPADPHQVDPRGLWLLLGLYVGTLLAAAVATPPIYLGFHAWAESVGPEGPSILVYLGEKDFPRYFDRIRWLFVLVALPWLCRRTGLASATALGLRPGPFPGSGADPAIRRRTLGWIAAGVATVAVVTAGQLGSGTASVVLPEGVGDLAAGLVYALASAALVGFLEELVFRGVVFQLVRATLRLLPAALVAALFFALMHFQRIPSSAWPDGGPDGAPVTWATGFVVAWKSLASIPTTLDPATLAALVLAGVILCLVFARSGSLWPAVGLHAGWVGTAQLHRRWIEIDPEARTALWGGRQMIDGAAALVCLALLAAALVVATGRGRATPRPAR